MKVIRNADNKLMNARIKDEIAFEACGVFQVREITKGSKWQEANIKDFREIKTKTIKCTWVDHSSQVKKSFKAGKRYQIEQGRVLGRGCWLCVRRGRRSLDALPRGGRIFRRWHLSVRG